MRLRYAVFAATFQTSKIERFNHIQNIFFVTKKCIVKTRTPEVGDLH